MNSDLLLTIGLVLTGLAAAMHVLIFYFESLAWTSPKVRAIFGTTETLARDTKELAFNQGFYNLFLAVEIAVGTALVVGDERAVGLALVYAGAGSMVAAGAVLLLSSPDKASAALKQLVPPLLGIVALLAATL